MEYCEIVCQHVINRVLQLGRKPRYKIAPLTLIFPVSEHLNRFDKGTITGLVDLLPPPAVDLDRGCS